jgi:N-acylneuraminate cytidylyltransferase
MSSIIAIVPARRYDRLLPNKNLLPFAGTTLLTHKLRQLSQLSFLDGIVVSSDDPACLAIARDEGVIPALRPVEHAGPESDFGEFVAHVANTVSAEHILWASPTSPLVDPEDYRLGVQTYTQHLGAKYDSLITVNRIKRNLLDENGPLTFRFERTRRTANQLPTLFEFTNGLVLAPRQSMIRWRYNWGPRPYPLELGPMKSINICDQQEYEYAQYLLARQSGRS